MKWGEKLRRWIEIWNRPTMAYVMVFFCALYETVLVTRLLLSPNVANQTLQRMRDTTVWGLPLFVIIIVLAVALLVLRRQRPTVSVLAISVLMLITAVLYGSAYTYLLLLWIVDIYACTVETRKPLTLTISLLLAGMFGVASVAVAAVWHHDGSTGLLYPTVLCFALCVFFGIISRTQRERYLSEQALINERERSLHLTEERDQAVNQSKIAAELHDSVGHDLTAIIALSEGLDNSTGNPEIDDAITMINDLARQGLADTRIAVKALQSASTADASQRSQEGRQHQWDDIHQILSHARQIGMIVAFTETGRRPQDSVQADLSFTITREAVTNAIRHGQSVDRIVISWDHDAEGAVAITIRDNGQKATKADSTGTGLSRLQGLVQERGGTFEAGVGTNGWMVHVTIPPTVSDSEQQGA